MIPIPQPERRTLNPDVPPLPARRVAWRAGLTLAKLAVGAGLITLLFRRQDVRWSMVTDAISHLVAHPLWLAATLTLVLACLLCGALRWWTALQGLGVPISHGRAAALFLVGHFFNGFLPGTTGGDVARALYVARATPQRGPEAVMSIVVERLAGVVMLLLLTIAGLLASPARHHLHVALAMLAGSAAAILAMLLALPDMPHFAAWPLLRRVAGHPRFGPLVARLYAALRLCRTRPVLVLDLLGWSLLQHACAVASWLTLAWGLGVTFQTVPFLLLVPALLTAQMIPLTPGGLGVRESAAVALLPAAGVPAHAAVLIALASFTVSLVWSGVGGLVFVALHEHNEPRAG